MPYRPKNIEAKWQSHWEENSLFQVEMDSGKPKFYALDMFPYPSGAGLHVGHPLGYTATDIVSRYKRMRGFNVLHPIGWDAYGLPAERYAIRTGVHPAVTTRQNIDNFRRQIKRLGFSYDWSREISTAHPKFVKWTQWIFLKLYERGLAYQAQVAVNWCPAQATVLANEEVKDGRYVETGDLVERRLMRQWMLKITAYAERLLTDLDDLDWPESVKAMQRHWIGKSEGAEVEFRIAESDARFTVFTTRPDTLFGATYCVLAPEHPIVGAITPEPMREAVDQYRAQAARQSELQRSDLNKTKTGVFTGAYAVNPVNGAAIPVWIADYVLPSYGSGAIMAVPAHDARDHAFAVAHGLPIVAVVEAPSEAAGASPDVYEGEGRLVRSGFLTGMDSGEARRAVVDWLKARGIGTGKVQYRLRDWLFSRQRYWGEPIPILHAQDGSISPLPEDALPLLPPVLEDYRPMDDGQPPLARAEGWLVVPTPEGTRLRETNTMPQWAGSSWYFLRYLDPRNDDALVSSEKEHYWMPVDLYVGGAEHAVLHLLYARFWHKVLYDAGVTSTKEPFKRLFNQGMILSYAYQDEAGRYHEPWRVKQEGGEYVSEGVKVVRQLEKMSKSRLNVVDPDEIVDEYGADAFRLYLMFMGPLDATKLWQTSSVAGMRRFLDRCWRLICDEDDACNASRLTAEEPDVSLTLILHQTVEAVASDIEALRFNTAIARLMELVNVLTPMPAYPRFAAETLVLLLAPFAPHLAEELWSKLGHTESLARAPWPEVELGGGVLAHETREYPIQINGKLRARITAKADLRGDELLARVKESPQVEALLEGRTIVKEIVVPGRLVNFVLGK